MAMNRIQFQPGLSLPVFIQHYGTEAQCEAALEQARWPQGVHCPRCGLDRIMSSTSALIAPSSARPVDSKLR